MCRLSMEMCLDLRPEWVKVCGWELVLQSCSPVDAHLLSPLPQRLPQQIYERNERLKEEMMGT